MNDNPIPISTAVGGVLATGVALLAVFLPGLTPETQALIIAFGNSVILLGVVAYSVARSTPVSNPKLVQGTDVTVVTPVGEADRLVTLTGNSGIALSPPG